MFCQDAEDYDKKLEPYQKVQKGKCNKKCKKLQDDGDEYISNSLTQLCNPNSGLFEKLIDERESGDYMLLEKYEGMGNQLLEKDKLINKKTRECEMLKSNNLSLEKMVVILENKLSKLKDKYQKMKNDYRELFLDYGRLSVENDSKEKKMKESEQFQRIFLQQSLAPSVVNIKGKNSRYSASMPNVPSSSSSSSSPSGQQSARTDGESPMVSASSSEKNYEENGRDLNVSTEQLRLSIDVVERDDAEPISLINQPSSSVPADVYNAYKLLLLTISDRLLYDNIIKLQEWANEEFAVQSSPLNAHDVFMELDKKGAITALDLSQLGVFFESIVRHDLVYLIHEFQNGDYDKLKKLVFQTKSRKKSGKTVSNSSQVHSSRVRIANGSTPVSSQRPKSNVLLSNAFVDVGNAQVLRKSSTAEDNNPTSVGCDHQDSRRFRSNFPSRSSSSIQGRLSMHRNSENVLNVSAVTKSRGKPGNDHEVNANDTPLMTSQVWDRTILQSRDSPSHCKNTHIPTGRCSTAPSNTDVHLHGSSNSNKEDNWLCDHYKRRCLVKFECCDKYWACHRCHNNESMCGQRKLKSRHTIMIKCVECGKEQQFGQFCASCNIQFADFFCGICKHLTGTDDHPYHCDKCSICRIHGDRSYHCDVCGICLDVQLRGNHKCRPDSAHDECCICLEDAFTGCQILPCSHKVHKECASHMIRMGITRCPICRESFAHKLERRPVKRKTTKRK